MTEYYWIRENGNGAYCTNTTLDDGAYNKDTCIFVPKQPTPSHRWNNKTKEWLLDEEDYIYQLRLVRNIELDRTDRYMTIDFPISQQDKNIAIVYRQALRECPNKPDIKDRLLPTCPLVLN